MNSDIIKAKAKLPIDFINDLYKDLGERNADKCLEGMCKKRFTTLRVNTLKSNKGTIKKCFDEQGIIYEEVIWHENAFIIKNKNEADLQKLDIYKEGKIYLQSLSSIIPPLVLEPKENDKILDLTAAPGSKTTEISALTNNKSNILANEIDKIRFEILKYNINLQGSNAKAINEDGANIGDKYPNYFDKVLIDAPCSGEGRFILEDAKTYSKWSEKLKHELSILQEKLLLSAIKSTKKGGTIVYSTCTLNKEEDENIVNKVIQKYNSQAEIDNIQENSAKIKIENIDFSLKNTIKVKHENGNRSLKIIPSEIMEGFYIAKLRKI